jgi:hypothetical protein
MGLAAGINFSMRSVIVTDTRYMAGNFQRQVQSDELLQMFGRAGRRGLDETGYVLFCSDVPRLGDARARQLKRAAQVDWPSFISVMRAAAERAESPFEAAVRLSHSLFSPQAVSIGAEHSLETGLRACGSWVDDDRARFVRRPTVEMLNSKNEWETITPVTGHSLGKTFVRENEHWIPALTVPRMLDGLGFGNLCRLRKQKIYGREIPIAMANGSDSVAPVKWLRKILKQKVVSLDALHAQVLPRIGEFTNGGKLSELVRRNETISARVDFSDVQIEARLDSHSVALHQPPEREMLPVVCRDCDQLEHDRNVRIVASPAHFWRTLGLIEADGTPTRRGTVFSFFQAGEGLAIAAALEDETYPISDLVFDLANIRAGPRFAGEDAPLGGRLGILCQQVYQRADHAGYLEMGVPVHYGAGASEVMREICENATGHSRLVNESLRVGDIERALMEWRSLLRHIVAAPDLHWDRWHELKTVAAHYVENTKSPTVLDLPPLLATQRKRIPVLA